MGGHAGGSVMSHDTGGGGPGRVRRQDERWKTNITSYSDHIHVMICKSQVAVCSAV